MWSLLISLLACESLSLPDDLDGDGFTVAAGDCNDADPTIYPGAAEDEEYDTGPGGDGIDDDCDGFIDNGTVHFDDDGDGACEVAPCVDGGPAGDCDDTNDTVFPNAAELEDRLDNDCDGVVDEGTDHYDDDGDGFTEDGGDCDDTDADISPAAPEDCRVLEIGCADGSNIITMAFHLPGSTFVGIDGSAPQIERGQKIVDDLSLDNITLLACDLRDVGEDMGDFDYIIAHGIFSWIAEDARHALMQLCRARLKPSGIAYISYNVYPGWHYYEQLRGMMRFHSRGMSSVTEEIQQARAIIRFVGDAIIDTGSPRAEFFKSVMPDILQMNDDYVYHEYLELNNRPMYFYEFIGMAMQHGMQYLGETMFHSMMSSNYPEKVAATLEDRQGRTRTPPSC